MQFTYTNSQQDNAMLLLGLSGVLPGDVTPGASVVVDINLPFRQLAHDIATNNTCKDFLLDFASAKVYKETIESFAS